MDAVTLFGIKVFVLCGLFIAFWVLFFRLLMILPADLWGLNKEATKKRMK